MLTYCVCCRLEVGNPGGLDGETDGAADVERRSCAAGSAPERERELARRHLNWS